MYRKLIESKLVRVTHEISFREGTRASDLIEELKNVPLKSKITEIEIDEDTGSTLLLFVEERAA